MQGRTDQHRSGLSMALLLHRLVFDSEYQPDQGGACEERFESSEPYEFFSAKFISSVKCHPPEWEIVKMAVSSSLDWLVRTALSGRI
tara:strand:- start:259 stop:519 length:261 start_codon:yes stop_codon:yes gene_type:complete